MYFLALFKNAKVSKLVGYDDATDVSYGQAHLEEQGLPSLVLEADSSQDCLDKLMFHNVPMCDVVQVPESEEASWL